MSYPQPFHRPYGRKVTIVRARCILLGAVSWLCLAGTLPSFAQSRAAITFERVAPTQEATSFPTTSILQDRQGFMWFGTVDGLVRYDGHDLVVFRHDPADSTSLSDDFVNYNALYEDRAGALWIGTRNGLSRRDPISGHFTQFHYDPDDAQSLSHNTVATIYETQAGDLWVGTARGLNRYDPVSHRFIRYFHDPADPASLSNNTITSMGEDGWGTLWVGTRAGLNAYKARTGRFTRYLHDARDAQSLPHNDVFGVRPDSRGHVWVATWGGGLGRLDLAKGRFTRYALPENRVMAIQEDQEGDLWIGTWGGGLSRLDVKTNALTHYRHDLDDPQSLSHDRVATLYQDRTGILWIGTWAGLDKVVPRNKFTVYHYRDGDPLSLSHPTVSEVYEDRQGTLWIGTLGGGLNRLDRDQGTVTVYRYDPDDPSSLSHNEVSSIAEDRAGVLWIGTLGGGLNRFNRAEETFTRYRHDPADSTSLSSNNLYAVYPGRQGGLWVGTVDQGLDRLDPAQNRFIHYRPDAQDPGSLSHLQVWPLFEDRMSTLWAGTLGGGLNKYDAEADVFTRYRHNPADSFSLSHDRVISIAEDQQGVLWIGTMGGGLNRFDRETERFERYSVKDGLAHKNATCLLPDEAGNLWVGTSNGLSMLAAGTRQFANYKEVDGLPSLKFYFGACHQTTRGELLFGSDRGLVAFHPDSLQRVPHNPPVAITALDVFNEPLPLDSSATYIKAVRLRYDQNFVSFHFSVLDFKAPADNQGAYKLDGVDTDWVKAGERRSAFYPNLVPGRYTFRVKGANADGVWNEEGAAVHLIILPPFWQTIWFRVLMTGVFFLLIFAAHRGRMRVVRARNRQLKANNQRLSEEITERQRAEADREQLINELEARNNELERFTYTVSHDLKTPLVTIKGFLGLLELDISQGNPDRVNADITQIGGAADKMGRLLDELLELSRIGRVVNPPEAIPLPDLVHEAVALVEGHLQVRRPIIEVPPDMPTIYGDRFRLLEVYQNLLDNAVKFMGEQAEPRIEVGAQSMNDEVLCFVRDNGIGIEPRFHEKVFGLFDRLQSDGEGTGVGLALVRRIVEVHGGHIWVESQGKDLGSTFYFTLPQRSSIAQRGNSLDILETVEAESG